MHVINESIPFNPWPSNVANSGIHQSRDGPPRSNACNAFHEGFIQGTARSLVVTLIKITVVTARWVIRFSPNMTQYDCASHEGDA